jgi:2,5-furandicarboxylate decarboxylase 1
VAKSLGGFIKMLEEQYPETILRVKAQLDPNQHELAAFITLLEERNQSPVVVFEDVKNLKGEKSMFPLVHNLFVTRSLCALAIGEDLSNSQMGLGIRFGEIEKKAGALEVVKQSDAPVLENVWRGDRADVNLLPAARYHEKDVGPYFVMACLMKARSGDFYDITPTKNLVHGPRRLSISTHGHHHLARIIAEYEALKEPTPVAVVLGHHPAFCLGSCALQPYGNHDYKTIASFMGESLRLTPSATLGNTFLIPADAEIIIEGTIPPEVREYQNPFGEISGHYQGRMLAPVIDVTAICFRNDAIMQGLMPGHAEHIILGGLPKEGSVYWAIKKIVPEVTAVHLPHSGMGRFSAHIALNKRTFRDVTVAAMVAFAEQPNLKVAIMVDSEIDVFNQTEVMWAVATQTRWDKDVTIIPKVQSFRDWLGDAVCIIDATHHEDVPDYPERNRIPEEALRRVAELWKL